MAAIMDEEDKTPMPAGLDPALWQKADEIHHAMALVSHDQECVKIIYAALSAGNDLYLSGFNDGWEAANGEPPEAALSAQVQDVAVPEGWQLVPKQPTEAMLKRGKGSGSEALSEYGVLEVWNDMLATAPTEQAQCMAAWQDISTAPESGDFLAEYKTGDWFVAERYDNPFGMLNTVIDRRSGKWWSPSRWMPLPPKQET